MSKFVWLLTFIFNISFSFVAVAQIASIDSLEVELKSVKSDTARLRVYVELIELYDQLAPSEKAMQRVLEGLDLAKRIGNEFAQAKLLQFRGQISNELYQSDYKSALSFLAQSLQLHRKLWKANPRNFAQQREIVSVLNSTAYLYWQWGKLVTSLSYYDSTIHLGSKLRLIDSTDFRTNRLLGIALNSKGAVLWGLGNYSEAIESYIDASAYFEQLGMTKFLSLAMSNIGLIYESWGQKEDALFYFKRAVSLAGQAEDASATGYALNNMGSFMRSAEQYDSALYYFQLSLDAYAEDNIGGMWLNLNGFGRTYARMKAYDKSLDYFFKALQLAEETNSDYRRALAKESISSTMADKGDYRKALQFANESNAVAEKHGYKEIIKDNYLNISRVYSLQNDFQKAYENYQRYSEVKDSLFSDEKFRQITLMKEQFEAEKKENENELLRRDSLLRDRDLQRARLEQYGLIILLLALLTFGGYFVVTNKKIKGINKVLTGKNLEITRQKEELALQAEALRKSNEIKNLMFSIVSHDLRGPIVNLGGLVGLISNESISKEEFQKLLPTVLTNIGSLTALTDNLLYWARSQMEGIKAVPQKFDIKEHLASKMQLYERAALEKGIICFDRLKPATMVYADPYMVELVVRNLISNAIKFCNAGDTITISSEESNSFVEITVKDTGQGIPPEYMERIFNDIQFTTLGTKNEKGVGLGLMMSKHFVEVIGGRIWVESIFKKGSSFHFTIPVSESSDLLAEN
jgi:two-component system, sensor histidine kinase and response regulator